VIEDRLGWLVAGLGVLAVLVALLSEPLGITHGSFGAKHVLLLVVGVALILGGLIAQRRMY
jgi:predicted phage tail protein